MKTSPVDILKTTNKLAVMKTSPVGILKTTNKITHVYR
jgi:hypothetical protein